MSIPVETGLMTFAEFERLPDPSSGHMELRHGEPIHAPPRKKIHFNIQRAIYDLLLPLLGRYGRLDVEFPFRPLPEYESWQADVAFVSADRWKADRNDYFLGSPELAIEVLSKSNTMDEMFDRQAICFSAGCLSFWIVDPKRQTILVTTPNGETTTYRESVPLFRPDLGAIEVAAVFH